MTTCLWFDRGEARAPGRRSMSEVTGYVFQSLAEVMQAPGTPDAA